MHTIFCGNSIYGQVERMLRANSEITDDDIFNEVKDVKSSGADGSLPKMKTRDEWQEVITRVRQRMAKQRS